MTAPARLRMSRTALVPVALLFVCVIPLAATAYVLRVGVDIGDDGLTVRSAVGARHVAWTDLAGIRIGRRRELWLVTRQATEVRLPVLRVGDLPRLAALSGGRIEAPAAPSAG